MYACRQTPDPTPRRAFYNPAVSISSSSPLQRWLTVLLVGLLMLAPFLHSHWGAAHSGGFHLDGMQRVKTAESQVAKDTASTEDESPALGVATSIVQENDGQTWLLAWALWLGALCVLPLPVLQGLRRSSTHTPVRRCYHPGLPPPGLSPPRTTWA